MDLNTSRAGNVQANVSGNYHTITVTGSADIRGSVKWNHILGVNRATTAMNTLKKVLATLHYSQVKFKLLNLNVSTKYAGYNLNRRATFVGTAGQ
jgi:outer membrane protein OmpA-like peptidoglycan-associated protein